MSPELCAEALFVSSLQPSDHPGQEAVQQAVTAMVLLHGSDGCAGQVAQEFGDHPESARPRMCWCRTTVREAFAMAGVR